jgi:hypothetical protein
MPGDSSALSWIVSACDVVARAGRRRDTGSRVLILAGLGSMVRVTPGRYNAGVPMPAVAARRRPSSGATYGSA